MATHWTPGVPRQITNLNGAGEFEDFMEVPFTTVPEGARGVVTVPLRQFTADFVRQLIEDRVAVIKEVGAL